MGLKHKLFGIVLLWPVLQGYAQEIKIGNYTFKDGAEYQGELFKGKPYGKGITHFKNGDSYEGEYVKGFTKVAISVCGSSKQAFTASNCCGWMKGSSPWMLTTTSYGLPCNT